MSKHEDLRIVAIGMNDDESELTFFLEGDNVISTKQFVTLIRLMESGNYTHIRGTANDGWTLSRRSDANSRQSKSDATLSQFKEP